MSDSAYTTIIKCEIAGPEKVLFLKRSNGEWWLPGGAIPEKTANYPKQSMYQWAVKYLGLWDWGIFGIGHWHLSSAAGGYAVHLYGSHMSSTDSIRITDTRHGLTTDFSWFTAQDIKRELYENKTMQWGQAKMAVYGLMDCADNGLRSSGEQLKDDLKIPGGTDWTRPL